MKQKLFSSKIIRLAIEEAKKVRVQSDYKFFQLGAVLFTNKKIIVSACNSNKTSPSQAKYNTFRFDFDGSNFKPCNHAEIAAIRKFTRLKSNIRSSDLCVLVYREHADGSKALARPCPACEKALRDLGIKYVYYTGEHKMVFEEYED